MTIAIPEIVFDCGVPGPSGAINVDRPMEGGVQAVAEMVCEMCGGGGRYLDAIWERRQDSDVRAAAARVSSLPEAEIRCQMCSVGRHWGPCRPVQRRTT